MSVLWDWDEPEVPKENPFSRENILAAFRKQQEKIQKIFHQQRFGPSCPIHTDMEDLLARV